ncbi:hypothetical protein HPP92_022024 [Vanilla planifolia]|uniref:Uncharacterized protein n=1 Tax=Vanilla planifolia TaxID=51239 RepID=A0A835Q5I5_VANPL|nr:hypothetical protein HPP92_022024 [Vanilla planifolia]
MKKTYLNSESLACELEKLQDIKIFQQGDDPLKKRLLNPINLTEPTLENTFLHSTVQGSSYSSNKSTRNGIFQGKKRRKSSMH